MGLVTWVVLGLIAGALGKLLMPGKDGGGFIMTTLLGIVGAVVGGFLGTRLGIGKVTGFDLKSLGIATGGAIVVLIAYRLVVQRKK